MIDFRYHLVSLISVFLALAIGVVLGAGPLRDTLGATLEEQVRALRGDKGDLQEAVANRDALLDQRDAFVEALSPQLLQGTLAGTEVALVVLPDVDDETSAATAESLVASGASVAVTATVSPSWLDAGSAPTRAEAAAALAGSLEAAGSATTDRASTEEVLADLLALAVLPAAGSGVAADTVRKGLDDAGLAEVVVTQGDAAGESGGATAGDASAPAATAPVPEPTRSVVLLAPAPPTVPEADVEADVEATTGATDGGGDPSQAAAPADGGWVPLLASLRERSTAAVLAGPVAAGEGRGLLAEVRSAGDGDGAGLDGASTVDGVDGVVGRVTLVLALREQLDGGVGSYGSSATAEAAAPPSTDSS